MRIQLLVRKCFKKMQLTDEQRVFVVKRYFQTRSYQQVQEEFRIRFPDRPVPQKTTIKKNVEKYEEHGTSQNRNKGHSGRRITVRTPENIQAVRERLENNPTGVSSRRNGLGLTKSSFNRITKKDLRLHPYKMLIRHKLREADLRRRLQFCHWFHARCNNRRFLANFVIGDEAGFALNGEVNNHNVRMYAPSNQPPDFHFDRNDAREKLTVWAGLCGNGDMVGPFLFNQNVNGQAYLNLLNEDVIPELVRIFGNQYQNGNFQRLWWAQDGAPCHRLIAVRDRLNQVFRNRVVMLFNENEWPPRSPDLTPCDFFLWGYLKDRVFKTPPENLQVLRQRIIDQCNILRENRAMIRNSVRHMRERTQRCIEQNGAHVEGNV